LAFVRLRKKRRSGGQKVVSTEGSSESSVTNAIKNHLRENPNEEEAALVHQVALRTGATEGTVLTQLSILSGSHTIEKVENGDATRYTVSDAHIPRDEFARMGMIAETIKDTVKRESPVTGKRLKEELRTFDLTEGEIRDRLLDLRGEVIWSPDADFRDFDSVVFEALAASSPSLSRDIVLDEDALPRFLEEDSKPPSNGKGRGRKSPMA